MLKQDACGAFLHFDCQEFKSKGKSSGLGFSSASTSFFHGTVAAGMGSDVIGEAKCKF